MSSRMRYTSGWLVEIPLAIFFMSDVFPDFGLESMRPRVPLPMGEKISTMRVSYDLTSSFGVRWSRSLGKIGTRCSNAVLFLIFSGGRPLTVRISKSRKCLSPFLGIFSVPLMVSPVLREYVLICVCDTWMSSALGR